jgi:threonine/homoserine/homoserine lactone efflux protein
MSAPFRAHPAPASDETPMPELISLVTFAIVAAISPGGATTLATASGAQFGMLRSIPLLAGMAAGLGALVGIVAGGLGSAIVSWPQLQVWLRIAGSVYLLWLAWTVGRLGPPQSKPGGPGRPLGFVAGVLLLWMNPKGWTMAVAAAGAYAGLADGPYSLALLLGSVFGTAAALSLTLWCTGGSWLSRMLRTEAQWRAANVILGLLLAASIVPLWR